MSTVSLKNFEALLTLRNDLRKKVEEGQNKLAEAIEKRRKVQDYLSQVSKALKLFTSEVDCLEEENNILLTELISLLEGHKTPTQDTAGNEPCLSELVSLFDDCSSQDTIESLREKLDCKYRPQYEDKLTLTDKRFQELEKQKKAKISVKLLDETNNPFFLLDNLKEGFTINWPVDASLTTSQREMLLLSHIIFTINNKSASAAPVASVQIQQSFSEAEGPVPWRYVHPARQKPTAAGEVMHPPSLAKTRTSSMSSNSSQTSSENKASTSSRYVSPSAPSKFIFYIFNSKKPFGQINIEPSASASNFPFTKILSDWCRFNHLESLTIHKVTVYFLL